METKIWGPSAWKFLHSVALVYPENPTDKDKQNYFNFYMNLQNILPCPRCKENYKKHLEIFPLQKALENNQSLFQWTVDIHNEVNKINNSRIYTYKEALDLYLNQSNNYDTIMLCGFIILIILVCIYLNKHRLF